MLATNANTTQVAAMPQVLSIPVPPSMLSVRVIGRGLENRALCG
jgi:hypothetical protein